MFSSGVILSGSTTFTNLFFRLSPVSFYLAQCALDKFGRCGIAWWLDLGHGAFISDPDGLLIGTRP
jgi:hypothetical protein